MTDEYIRKQDAVNTLWKEPSYTDPLNVLAEARDRIESLEPADVVPYSIEPDGTLTVTVPKCTKVGRVLVQEDGTHCGGLYYAD